MVLGKLPVPGRPTILITVGLGCLVGCFGFSGPLREYFSLYRAVSQREGERGEKRIVKMSKQRLTRTYCKRNRPLPYYHPKCRTPRHWKFTQDHRTTRPPPITEGQGPIALSVGAGGVVWTLLLSSILSPLSPSLWETARYRLKYCLKGPLNPKQPTNQQLLIYRYSRPSL